MSNDTTPPAVTLADEETHAGTAGAADNTQADVIVLAGDDTVVIHTDGNETQDGGDKHESGEHDTEHDDGAKKRPSGSARLKARIERLSRENEELRRSLAHAPAPQGDDSDLVPPREQDFKHDYFAYERALQDYRVRKAIRDEHRRIADQQQHQRAAQEHRARLSAYRERLDEVKDRIPDFDEVMRGSHAIALRDDVLGLVIGDKKGPLIAYHLARNPEKIEALNAMHPIEAAREIGSLSARIRGPMVRKTTNAPPPPTYPSGGGIAPRGRDYADMSMDEYVRARAAELKDR
jgi:hypothetical protein